MTQPLGLNTIAGQCHLIAASASSHVTQAQSHAGWLDGEPAFAHTEEMIKAFAALNSGCAIRNTDLEGGNPMDAFTYYDHLLKLKCFPVEHQLHSKQFAAVLQANENLISFKKKIDALQNPGDIITEIIRECQAKKVCYIPAGLIDRDGGHYVTLKARLLEDGRLAFSFINYGYGAQYHRPVATGKSKTKSDYLSEEYAMDPQSPNTREFCERLLALMSETRILDEKSMQYVRWFEDVELYALLGLYGQLLDNKRNRPERAVTSQRGGICYMINTRGASRDALLDEGSISAIGIKRFQYAIKLASIVEAFKAYKKRSWDEKQETFSLILKDAVEELLVRNAKLYPESLTSEELERSRAIASEIMARLKSVWEVSIQKACQPYPWPSFTGMLPPPGEPESKADDKPPVIPSNQATLPPFPTFISEPAQFVNQLKTAKEILSTPVSPDPMLFMRLRRFLLSLPPRTTGDPKGTFWQEIPASDLPSIIQVLREILDTNARFRWVTNAMDVRQQDVSSNFKCHNKTNICEDDCRIHQFEVSLLIYDIVAELAQQNSGSEAAKSRKAIRFPTGYSLCRSRVLS